MKLVVFVLKKEELLGDVLTTFKEAGIEDATIIDSVGMEKVLAYDVPLFAELRNMLKEAHLYTRTIFAVVEDEIIDELIKLLEDVCGDLSQPGNGTFFVIPVEKIKGPGKNRR